MIDISNLKIGDPIVTVETYGSLVLKYLATVIDIKSNYIEVVFTRPYHEEYSKYLRWGCEQTTKCYFGLGNKINLEYM